MYFWPERQKFAISAETAQFWGFGIGPATRQPLIRIPAEAGHRESLQGASLSSTGFTASQSIFTCEDKKWGGYASVKIYYNKFVFF